MATVLPSSEMWIHKQMYHLIGSRQYISWNALQCAISLCFREFHSELWHDSLTCLDSQRECPSALIHSWFLGAEDVDEEDRRPTQRRRVDRAQAGIVDDGNDLVSIICLPGTDCLFSKAQVFADQTIVPCQPWQSVACSLSYIKHYLGMW